MKVAEIRTLTPVHIGSGSQALKNIDFLYFEALRQVSMLDADKVFDILGEENIEQWMECIKQGDGLIDLLRTHKGALFPTDISLRTMSVHDEGLAQKQYIKEHVHTGLGVPLLPGSTIKGSIRTALFVHFIRNNHCRDVKNIRNMCKDPDGSLRKMKFNQSKLNNKYFGVSPNNDILRLLKVMDSTFDTTECYRSGIVNYIGNQWKEDERFTQFVEAIPANASTSLVINFDEMAAKNWENKQFKTNDTSLLQLDSLFKIINQHTLYVIKSEQEFWKKQVTPFIIDKYLNVLNNITESINNVGNKECILRLGWGVGFLSMTGSWHGAMNKEDYIKLVSVLRSPKYYNPMLYFPKTTRLLQNGTPLGFVKIKLK
jgi:CRISPR type III-A-associated RAMP protein Csm5